MILGGTWYLVAFHDTVWFEHCDGMGGSSAKNELIGSGSVDKQLEFDESPTVWIEDTNTPPVPSLATVRRIIVSNLNSCIAAGEKERTGRIGYGEDELCSTLEWQYIEGVIGSLRFGVMYGGE